MRYEKYELTRPSPFPYVNLIVAPFYLIKIGQVYPILRQCQDLKMQKMKAVHIYYHLLIWANQTQSTSLCKPNCCSQPWVWHMFWKRACDGLCGLQTFIGCGWNIKVVSIVKNVLQFLLIFAHNLIEFNTVSRCTNYLPTLHGVCCLLIVCTGAEKLGHLLTHMSGRNV